MSDIFISYASEDRAKARTLGQFFENEGWSTFWDRTIPVGKTWHQIIGKELTEARCLVVLWSQASISSTWVLEEADEGKRREILIPILIEPVLPPFGFRGIQAGDLSDWDGKQATSEFQSLISHIAQLVGTSPREGKEQKSRMAKAQETPQTEYRERVDRDTAPGHEAPANETEREHEADADLARPKVERQTKTQYETKTAVDLSPEKVANDDASTAWWAFGLRGLLGIAFGLVCVYFPTYILAIFFLFSAYVLVDGVLAIVSGIKAARNGGLLILEGVVDLAAGTVFLTNITAVAFSHLIAVWAIISGALLLAAALSLKLDHERWWLALGGIASLIFGIVVFIAFQLGMLMFTWWLGVYALVFGVLLLVFAVRQSRGATWR